MDINSVYQPIVKFAEHNPFLTGGASVAALSFAGNWLRTLPQQITSRVTDYLLTTVRVETDSMVYGRLGVYFDQLNVIGKHNLAHTDGEERIVLTPTNGFAKWFIFEGSLFRVSKHRPVQARAANQTISDFLSVCEPNHYMVTGFTADRLAPKRFLQHVWDTTKSDRTRRYIWVYTNSGDTWSAFGSIEKKQLPSVIYADNILNQALTDARLFIDSKDSYHEKGVPHHRGYLLYGPPGNGKTSMALALASELDRDLCLLDLSTVRDDAQLRQLFSSPALILIEDIDCLFGNRDSEVKASFSGLLNAMDGICTTKGAIYIMTTNHIDCLDPALLRPGRADKKFYIGNAEEDQAEKLFKKFYPDSNGDGREFASKIPAGQISMATLQGHFLEHPNDAKAALDNAHKLLNVS